MTPVVVANLSAIGEACSTYGIKQGLKLYLTHGASGVITFIEADMADGDSSVDDLISASINMSKIEAHVFFSGSC